MTPVRAAILAYLASHRTPVGLERIAQAEGVFEHCDPTTVYRTLVMFKEAGLVRPVGTPRKTRQLVLNVPDDEVHFVICERCGAVEELEPPPGTLSAVRQLAADHGFAVSRQSLEVHGLCRNCEIAVRSGVMATKLISRDSSL